MAHIILAGTQRTSWRGRTWWRTRAWGTFSYYNNIFNTLFKVSRVYIWHFCVRRTNQTWLNPFVCSNFLGRAWCRRRTGCHWRTGVKGQQHLTIFFCNHPFNLCILEVFCHVEIQSQPPSSSRKNHDLAFSQFFLFIYFFLEIAVVSGEIANCTTLPQLHKSVVTESVEVCMHTSYIFWPPNGPVLCFVSLQGDVGPPGAEGEQGQEGVRVSHYKQPTNPFLPCVWVNVTRSFVYSPSLWRGCLIPRTKESRMMELFLSGGLYK